MPCGGPRRSISICNTNRFDVSNAEKLSSALTEELHTGVALETQMKMSTFSIVHLYVNDSEKLPGQLPAGVALRTQANDLYPQH